MSFEPKDMSGSLFKNDRKSHDAQPNAKGSAVIGGVPYWVSAWTKKDKNGNPWQSLSFTRKDGAQRGRPDPDPTNGDRFDRDDGDIPF
jgi:hypothetical protein